MEARILVLFAIVASVAAGPVRLETDTTNKCAQTCIPSQKFRYQTGKTYTYDYSVVTETSVDGASEDSAILTIRGRADIEVIDSCEMVLLLKDMSVSDPRLSKKSTPALSDRSDEFKQTLEQFSLRFSYQDGKVSELCPNQDEDSWALNIKRGVLSALQNSMDTLEGKQAVLEVDVTGRCQAEYEVTKKGWYSVSVKRTKDLMACTDRQGYSGSLQTTPYQVTSDFQTLPLMNSVHECVQDVNKQGIVQTSTCTESHIFRPFSSQSGGARTTVTQKLTYKTERTGITTRKGLIQFRAEMPFDHNFGISSSGEARTRAEALLNELCDTTMNGVRPETPRMFSQLVSAVQKMETIDIQDLYRQLKTQAICGNNNQRTKKFFMDALPMAGTTSSIEVIKNLLITGDVTGMEVDLWLTLLALIPSPSSEMLTIVKDLLDKDTLKMKAMLPVSTMVNNYCISRDDCSSDTAVDNIMTSLERTIGSSCYPTDSNIQTTLLALSAIGNTGQARATRVLNRCLASSISTEVRVAAIQAFRRMPCDTDKDALLNIFKNTDEDSETRISAYQQIMVCPTSDLLNQIQVVIESEESRSQVGAFVWTHLANLMETSSPLKQEIKSLVDDVVTKKQFETNPVQFSRNYEKSVFLKMLNMGAQVESNVIFSSQSSLPRFVNLNMTFDLFGHSVNLLEIGGRLEGLEYLMEFVFGPYSFFGDGKDNTADKQAKMEQLKGSFYTRIFGNQMTYNRFQGISSLTSGKTFNLLDFLIELSKDHDIGFTQSMQFLDSSITIPTASGLPLSLSVNSTATVDLRAKGKMDLRSVSASPRSIYIDGELRPSVAVNVDGVMSVDAGYTRTGLRVSGSLHSSLAVKGRVELDRGRVLSVQIDMPDNRIDLLDIRTQFFILGDTEEKEQKMVTDNRKEFELCSGKSLARITGLELCGQLQFPNASMQTAGPYYPLTGPSLISLVLHKRDSHTGYKLLAKRVENKISSIAQLSFDTPGSSIQRAISFDMMINHEQKEVEVTAASPWKKATFRGALVNDPGMKSLTGSVLLDESDTYSFTSEVKIDDQNQDGMVVFTPLIELRRPDTESIKLTGSVQMDTKGQRLNSELTFSGTTEQPLQLQVTYTNIQTEKSFSGIFTKDGKPYQARVGMTYNVEVKKRKGVTAAFTPFLLLSTPTAELASLSGSANYQSDKITTDITLDVPILSNKPISVKFDMLAKPRGSAGTKYDVDLRIKSRPLTTKLIGFVQTKDSVVMSKMSLDYTILRFGTDRISLDAKFSDKSTPAYLKYGLNSNIDFKSNPDRNMEINLDFDHKQKRSEVGVKMTVGKDPEDKKKTILLSTSIDHKIVSISEMSFDYKLKAVIPMINVDVSVNGNHSHAPDTLASKVAVKYGKDQNVMASVALKDKSEQQMRYTGEASLSFPGHSYQVDTSIREKSGQYFHTLNVKSQEEQMLALTSTLKSTEREITSDISIIGFDPIKVSGSANLDLDNLQLAGLVIHGKDNYGVSVQYKSSRGPRGKLTVDLMHPSRHVVLTGNGGLRKDDVDGELEFAWDKDNEPSAKITVGTSGSYKSNREATSTSGKLTFTSPFRPIESLSASLSYNNDGKRYGLDGKFTLGDKSNQISSSLNLIKPVSLQNVQMTWTAETPFKGFQRLEGSVMHSMDDSSLTTTLKGVRGKSTAQLTMTAMKNAWDYNNHDLRGDLTFKSDIGAVMDIGASFAHKDDGARYMTNGNVNYNGDRYKADLDMTHYLRRWNVQNNGQLKVTIPGQDITATWQHMNTNEDIKTVLTSTWGRTQQLQVEFKGNHQISDIRTISGTLSIRSPWKQIRDLNVDLKHELGTGRVKNVVVLIHNSQKKVSSNVLFTLDGDSSEMEFFLMSPFHDDITAKASSNYGQFPISGHVELQWTPTKMIVGDASLSNGDLTDFEGIVHLTSPFANAIAVKVSTKTEGDDLISAGSLDYGVRKYFNFETRIRPDTLSLARIKINSPYTELSTLNTGYEFSWFSNGFDGSADFDLSPVVGKYSGTFNWKRLNDFTGKLRINTPLIQFPYLQVTATSQKKNQGVRTSRIEAELSPRKIYALTSAYSFESPILFTTHIETPIDGYNNFGVSLKHQGDDSSILTQGEIQYLPDKVIESTLKLNWARTIEGSFVVKTPFEQFKESLISLRHEGKWDDFTCHGEVKIAEKTASADAQFKYGYNTGGLFTLNIPLYGLEKIEASVNNRGTLDNFRGSASLLYGSKKIEGTLRNKFTTRSLKSGLTLTTPYTENVDISIDYGTKQNNVVTVVTGTYGTQYKIDGQVNYDIGDVDISASTNLKYTIAGRPNSITGTFMKKGTYDDLELTSTFTSPFTSDISFSTRHTCQWPQTMKTIISGSYGQDYTLEHTVNFNYQSPDLSASTSLKYKMANLMNEVSASIEKQGELSDLTITTTGKFGDQEVSISGLLNTLNGFRTKVSGKTPFAMYENLETELTFMQTPTGFSTQGFTQYMQDKKVQHKISYDFQGLSNVQFDFSLTSPIPNLEQTIVKVRHISDSSMAKCEGSAQFISALGDKRLAYRRTGDLNNLNVVGSVQNDDEKYEGTFTRLPLTNGYKHSIQMQGFESTVTADMEYQLTDSSINGKASYSLDDSTSFQAEGSGRVIGSKVDVTGKLNVDSSYLRKTATFSLAKNGALDDFTIDLRTTNDNQDIRAFTQFKNQLGQISGELTLNTPFVGFQNVGTSFKHSGKSDRLNSEGKLTYADGKTISAKTSFYNYQWRRMEATVDLSTPFSGFETTKAEYRHTGSADGLTCSAFIQYGASQRLSFDLSGTVSPKAGFSLSVKTPFKPYQSMSADATLETMGYGGSLKTSLDLGRGKLFAASGSLDLESTPMTFTGKLTSPFQQINNVELSLSHQGRIDDFSCSLTFNSPQTAVVKGDVEFKYVSPTDLNAVASLSSQLNGYEDLRFEARNGNSGDTMNGLVVVQWAPKTQISLGGAFTSKDFWNNKQMQADITLSTPFQKLLNAAVHMEHTQLDMKYAPKIDFIVNGETLLDMDAEYTQSDSTPATSVTLRKPWPMQLTAAVTNKGDTQASEVYVNWNRDRLDQNVRLQTTAKNMNDDSQLDVAYSVKVTHPFRTVSADVAVLSTTNKLTSQGNIAWDDRDGKLSYDVQLTDRSTSIRKMQDGKITFGTPSRTLETSGSFSVNRQTSVLEGTFGWDAGRDTTKQVGFNAKVITGEKTRTDITFRLPAIGKEVRIENELAVNNGRMLWDGKTALSYSKDARKTLTLSSSLKDLSDTYSDGKNYSLELAITHPYTSVDLKMSSHLGVIGDRYSAAIDTWYMTVNRQKKNMALRGEIDRLRRQIDLQLVSPIKTVSLHGEVTSDEPYTLSLTNRYDEDGVIQAGIIIDSARRSFAFRTNYDLDNPDNMLVLSAKYVNSSAISAELYREMKDMRVQDSVMAMRLNTSTLLHTRLAWRPETLGEFQDYASGKARAYTSATTASLTDVYDALGQELSVKYSLISTEINSELKPVVDLLENELARIGQQIDMVQQEMTRMHRRNDFYLQDMSQPMVDGFIRLRDSLRQLKTEYEQGYVALLSKINQNLGSFRNFPLLQRYRDTMLSVVKTAESILGQGLISVNRVITEIDDYLLTVTRTVRQTWQNAQSLPQIQQVKNRVQLLGSDYRQLLSNLGRPIQGFSIPQEYTSAIYATRENINQGLSNLLRRDDVQSVTAVANEMYQQGVWAYNYWQVEENIKKHAESIVRLVAQLIEDEFAKVTGRLHFLRQSRVTFYDPQRGEIQAEIFLPIPLKSLNEMPDVDTYIKDVQNAVNTYLPEKETIVQYYNRYFGLYLWPDNTTKADDLQVQLEAYEPSKFVRRTNSQRRWGNFKQ